MSEFAEGTASGDYDNETANIIEKRRLRKQKEFEENIGKDEDSDECDASLEIWENDGGRRSDEPPTSSGSST